MDFLTTWTRRGEFSSPLTAWTAAARLNMMDVRHNRVYRLNSTELVTDPCAPRAAWQHVLIATPWRFGPPGSIAQVALQQAVAHAYRRWPKTPRVSLAVGARALDALDDVHVVTLRSIDDIQMALVHGLGPVAVGMPWTEDLEFPDLGGTAHVTGPVLGGHAVVLTAADQIRGVVRMTNNRGLAWGQAGRAWLPIVELKQVLQRQSWEAFTVVPHRPVPKTVS